MGPQDGPEPTAWMAEGECAHCAGSLQHRAQGPGVWSVTCRSCGELTPLRARRVAGLPSVRAGDDPSTTPLGLPRRQAKAARNATKEERRGDVFALPRVERHRRNLWAAPTVAFGVLLVAVALFLALVPAPEDPGGQESVAPPEAMESQVQLYLNDSAASPGAVTIELLHEDALLQSQRVQTTPRDDGSNASLALEAAVPAGPLQLRVLDDAGTVLLDTTFNASDCAGGLLRVGLALEGDVARIEETSCVVD